MKLTKINRSYDLSNDRILLYFSLAVPTDREKEVTEKLNALMDWFMDKEKIKQHDPATN